MGIESVFDLFFAVLYELSVFDAFYWLCCAGVVFGAVSLIFYVIRGDRRA